MKFNNRVVRFVAAVAAVGAISTMIPMGNDVAIAQNDRYLSNKKNDVIKGAVIGIAGYGLYNALTSGGGRIVETTVKIPGTPVNPPGAGMGAGGSTTPVAARGALDPIYDVAAGNTDFSSLKGAIDFGSFEEKGGDDLVRLLRREKGLTVFAPTNSAFAKIQAAVASLTKDNKNEANRKAVRGILAGHVVRGVYTIAQLKGMTGKSLTTLGGKSLAITTNSGGLQVNGITVVQTDVEATNGIIHPIESVIQ
jgi:uncharacterized surface protein with fasciclin (FAS1) repeats